MKKILTILLIAALTAAMTSCNSGTGEDLPETGTVNLPVSDTSAQDTTAATTAVTTETPVTEASVSAEGYLCTFDNGVQIKLGAAAADTIAALGEYSDMMEAPSCVHEGFDRVYTYAGMYTVTTSPDASGNAYVAEVSLLSDLAALQVGDLYLTIGSTGDEVKAVFGEPAEDAFGVQKYLIAGANVTVTLDGDTVTGLALTYSSEG